MILNKLRHSTIAKLKNGCHADGGNLYLRVRGDGKFWVFRYTQDKKAHELGLGSFHDVTIAEAREKAASLRARLSRGEVLHAKRHSVARYELKDIYEGAIEWYVQQRKPKHPEELYKVLCNVTRTYLLSDVGSYTLDELKAPIIASVVSKCATSRTQKGKVEVIFKACFTYAKLKGFTEARFPAEYKELVLVKLSPEHHKSLPWRELPAFFAKLMAVPQCPERDALAFTILCATRVNEGLALTESDIDRTSRIIIVRDTKNGTDFEIPYASQTEPFIQTDTRLHRNAVLRILKRLDPEVTVHGFRATFSTWCAEHGEDYEVREASLNHTNQNKVAAAYQRSTLLERRRVLLQKWADYVTSHQSS